LVGWCWLVGRCGCCVYCWRDWAAAGAAQPDSSALGPSLRQSPLDWCLAAAIAVHAPQPAVRDDDSQPLSRLLLLQHGPLLQKSLRPSTHPPTPPTNRPRSCRASTHQLAGAVATRTDSASVPSRRDAAADVAACNAARAIGAPADAVLAGVPGLQQCDVLKNQSCDVERV
jgi:hypothetical protein